MSILAIDQGTTSTRALKVDSAGNIKVTCMVKHQQFFPQQGWIEHDAEELITNIETCLASAGSDISAIGIDNQGESCLAWHADTKAALCPVIVWQDNRTHHEVEQLKTDGVEEQVMELCGLPLDSYFSASKQAWIIQHIPMAKELLRQGKLSLGTTDAFFLDRLTGRFVTDISTASRTSLMNLQTGQWDPVLCEIFKVPIATLPTIVPTVGDFGEVVVNDKSVPITASVVDQQASLYGHNCRQKGDAKITFGTGAFALTLTGNAPLRSPQQGLLPTVAWKIGSNSPEYALDGGIYNAGSAIDWGRSLGLFKNYSELNAFDRPAAIDRQLVFIPALSGLACPHWDRSAAGVWAGMSLDTDKRDLIQSILEGVALRATEVVQAMNAFIPVKDTISVDGGVTSNPYFCQFLANALQQQVTVKPMAELTAIGTSQLAGGTKVNPKQFAKMTQKYQPESPKSDYLARFTVAINCAKDWRR